MHELIIIGECFYMIYDFKSQSTVSVVHSTVYTLTFPGWSLWLNKATARLVSTAVHKLLARGAGPKIPSLCPSH